MLSPALKEWSVAVDALVQGQSILLLRKGGLREVGKHFQVPHPQVWLYPTYEHQKQHLLKSPWADQVQVVTPGWHPTQVTIQAWADIPHVWTIRRFETVNALLPFHVWNEQFVTERFRWKPSQPLHLLLLRVHRLSVPLKIDWQSGYGGCRSWLTLENEFNPLPSVPVLDEQTFAMAVANIRSQIAVFEAVNPSQGNATI